MPKLKINDIEIEVEAGTSVLQAAEQMGIEIPRFCYHDRLSVPANCRMCLVEVKPGPPKPQASCALACADGMEVFTDSPLVHKARKGVMEFLLINHPLDCPICDQGGECDLQDQAVAYGYDRSRYFETKRAVKDKELGPLVATVMTRCIQCTRCVRFADEIAGSPDLGFLNRGEDVEIGTYIQKSISSELSGNLVDVCPVGALTSKPYKFTARPWELRKTESIDVMDAVGSNIRVDSRGNAVMRILPRLNEAVNEEWIADKSRYAYDGLMRQRLDTPYVRHEGKLEPASWEEAFVRIAQQMEGVKPTDMAVLAGDLVDVESSLALKELFEDLGVSDFECRVDGADIDPSSPFGYRFNTTIQAIEKSDHIVIVGCNPRVEAPMINARIRKTWLANEAKIGVGGGVKISVVGPKLDLNYPYTHVGTDMAAFEAMDIAGERPMIILGTAALKRADARAVLASVRAKAVMRDDWAGFNLLHVAAGRVGSLMLGFVPQNGQMLNVSGKSFVWLHGVDTDVVGKIDADAFVVYQGHHGDVGANRADVVLPGCAYTEKNALYVNTEGRVQMARQAITPLGDAKEDWKIIRAFSEVLGRPLGYNSLAELRAALVAKFAGFAYIDDIAPIENAAKGAPEFGAKGPLSPEPLGVAFDNYYQTDVISRASVTMAECVEAFVKKDLAKVA